VFKRIGVLSGGERKPVCDGAHAPAAAEFLLLDEPTNHLDLQAKDVLLEALAEFTGTVVFVSHDRYFIDKLATRIFQIEGGGLYDYPAITKDFFVAKGAPRIWGASSDGELRPGHATHGEGSARS